MTQTEHDPLQLFKNEADENLFANLHFDHSMKEEVMQKLNVKDDRYFRKKWFHSNGIKWVLSMMSAAVAAGIIMITIPHVQEDQIMHPNDRPPLNGEVEGQVPLATPLIAEDNKHTDPDLMQQFALDSLDAAKASFGDRFLVASHRPDRFQISEIVALGKSIDKADTISVSYVSDDRTYVIIQQKLNIPYPFHDEEKTEIHGIDAYISMNEPDTLSIEWYADKVLYTVSGTIPKEQLLRVARSLYE